MVTAGFEATVAPLGTALTADQLALMWRMADEPMLCFDGDDAGRRAAYRALDLALPLLKPGKSLKLATLPDGQDPDDLARSGGREAIEDVLGAARPLAQVLWTRESEAGPFDTPERRAALEARIGEVTAASPTKRCAAITGRISPSGCARCSRRQTFRRGRRSFGDRKLRRPELPAAKLRQRASAPKRVAQRAAARCDARRRSSAATTPMSRPARSLRQARCIAAIAPRSRAAKR